MAADLQRLKAGQSLRARGRRRRWRNCAGLTGIPFMLMSAGGATTSRRRKT
jgi:hypothetical protein